MHLQRVTFKRKVFDFVQKSIHRLWRKQYLLYKIMLYKLFLLKNKKKDIWTPYATNKR